MLSKLFASTNKSKYKYTYCWWSWSYGRIPDPRTPSIHWETMRTTNQRDQISLKMMTLTDNVLSLTSNVLHLSRHLFIWRIKKKKTKMNKIHILFIKNIYLNWTVAFFIDIDQTFGQMWSKYLGICDWT